MPNNRPRYDIEKHLKTTKNTFNELHNARFNILWVYEENVSIKYIIDKCFHLPFFQESCAVQSTENRTETKINTKN